MSDPIWAAIELSRLPGVGARGFRDLLDRFGDAPTALAHWRHELARRRAPLLHVSRRKYTPPDAFRDARAWLHAGGCAVHLGQPGYPAALLALSEPPPVLFIRGTLPALPGVAIVGTRRPDPCGAALASQATAQFARTGAAIVSGGALGVDASAHRTALTLGVPTVAVLGTGVDVAYPPAHAALFAEIVAGGGAIVSELLPGTGPQRGFFPTRNRIIAALAHTVVVVQAAQRSGARITARHARRLGRRLLVCAPPDPCPPTWFGNRAELAGGAEPLTLGVR